MEFGNYQSRSSSFSRCSLLSISQCRPVSSVNLTFKVKRGYSS